MKIFIACDSFKGSLSSNEIADILQEEIMKMCPNSQIIAMPLADGGEGTVDVLIDTLKADRIYIKASNPLGKEIDTYYGIVKNDNMAIIESASTCGMTLINQSKLNPNKTSTLGVGQTILNAINKGITNFIVGIGGSATNDGGMGLLHALGFRFMDKSGNILKPCGENLLKLSKISDNYVNRDVYKCQFTLACDVDNPLYGLEGASYMFARQKGADDRMIKRLDEGLQNFSHITKKFTGKNLSMQKGAGGAGGLTFAFTSYLNAKVESGADLIIKLCKFKNIIKEADLIITGEGKIDAQTLHGKAPAILAKLAKKYHKPIIAIGGCIDKNIDINDINNIFTASFSIINEPMSLDKAMDKQISKQNLEMTIAQIMSLIINI